jgi:hypothetical protein
VTVLALDAVLALLVVELAHALYRSRWFLVFAARALALPP